MIIPTKGELAWLIELIATYYELDEAADGIDFDEPTPDQAETIQKANHACARMDGWFKKYANPNSPNGKWDHESKEVYYRRGHELSERRKNAPVLFCSVEID